MATLHAHPHSPSRAERKFADSCRNLSDGWHVFFGVEWTRAGEAGEGDRSGEIDAVLYHRDHGMVVVEVKGGGVRRDGDRWASMGRDGWHPIKNPLAQVRESSWFLVHEFKELSRSHPGDGFPLVAWALCFPDVEVPRNEWLGQDLLPHQILSRKDLPRLEKRLKDIAQRVGHGLRHTRPSESLEADILGRFHPCFALLPPATDMLAEEGRQMMEATEHQQQFLQAARSISRLAVDGCAGSGKSILAADRARLLTRDGEDVLLLCHSRFLADRWRADRSLSGILVDTFHGFARKWIDASDLGWPEPSQDHDAWEDEIREKLRKAQEIGVMARLSAIVVDEGQDFDPRWWPLVEGFLDRPGQGGLTIFLDRRQNLLHRDIALPEGLPVFRLSYSVRNTRSIVDWIRARTGWELGVDPLCPAGEPPRERSYRNPREQEALLAEDLAELAASGIEPDRILVVSCRDRESSGLSRVPPEFPAGWSSPPEVWRDDRVNIDSALRTRGLEADVVILADLQPDTPAERIYAAATRAKHRLFVYSRN